MGKKKEKKEKKAGKRMSKKELVKVLEKGGTNHLQLMRWGFDGVHKLQIGSRLK